MSAGTLRLAEGGGIRTHGIVTPYNGFRDRALRQAFVKKRSSKSKQLASATEPRESHDQGANNAGCEPSQPIFKPAASASTWYVLEQI
jgi:hypothetical protein